MNWLRSVWKWIVGMIVILVLLGLWIGSCWLLWSSLFGANEATKAAVHDVNESIKGLGKDVKEDKKINEEIRDTVKGLPAAFKAANSDLLTEFIRQLKPQQAPVGADVVPPGGATATTSAAAVPVATLIARLKNANSQVVENAQSALIKCGEEAAPELVQAFEDKDLRVKATWCLKRIGAPGIKHLAEAFASNDNVVVGCAKITAKYIGQSAVAELEKLKNHGDPQVVAVAQEAIALILNHEEDQDGQIAQLQTQSSQDKKRLTAVEGGLATKSSTQYVDDQVANLRSETDTKIDAKIKAAMEEAQRTPRPQQLQLTPQPAPTETSATMPGAAQPRVVYSTPYSYYGVTRRYGCR